MHYSCLAIGKNWQEDFEKYSYDFYSYELIPIANIYRRFCVKPKDHLTDTMMLKWVRSEMYNNFGRFLLIAEDDFDETIYQQAASIRIEGIIVFDAAGKPNCVSSRKQGTVWDWYVVGGRWSNLLMNKDGIAVDSCKKSNIDIAKSFAGCQKFSTDLEYKSLRELWNKYQGKTKTFLQVCKEKGVDYYNQPICNLLAADLKLYMEVRNEWSDQEIFKDKFIYHLDRYELLEIMTYNASELEEYIRLSRILPTYAYLHEGVFNSMDYWSTPFTDTFFMNYQRARVAAIEKSSDDDLFTIVDYHN